MTWAAILLAIWKALSWVRDAALVFFSWVAGRDSARLESKIAEANAREKVEKATTDALSTISDNDEFIDRVRRSGF